MFRKRKQLLIVLILTIMLLPNLQSQNTFAATENYSDIIKNSPKGLDISKYFNVGNFSLSDSEDSASYPFQTNSAAVYSDTNNTYSRNGKVLVLAKSGETVPSSSDSDTNMPQTGAAWSKNDNDNYIDISKDSQTVSVWLYFGSGDGTDPSDNGEGMSLVLQNDKRGANAMGAGYQGMGVLGYDNIQTAQSALWQIFKYGDWNEDTSSASTINTPEQAAGTAVSNSIALDFNSQINSLTASTLITPKVIGYTPETMSTLGRFKYRNKEYELGSFGTVKANYSTPTTYPEYDNLINRTDLGYFPVRLGNSGDAYGTISLTYPGSAVTYKNVPMDGLRGDSKINSDYNTNNPWTLINNFSKGYGMSTYQVGSKSASLIDGSYNGEDLYWHHLTFTWHKASGDNPATISYAFNDKMPDGSTNTGQGSNYSEVKETIPVDPSVFGNPKDNKVYWGLTGANGDNNTFSKLAVFESIPALATAQVTTKLTDTTLDKTISDDTSMTDKTARTVSNGDDLSLDYNLVWNTESRQNWSNIVSEMNLPNDVAYKSATITYHDGNGNSSQPITIASDTDLSTNSLKYTIEELGNIANSSGYTSADIVVNGSANNETGKLLTEDSKPATFEGDNAIETTSTPVFYIDSNEIPKKSLQLTVSNNLSFQDVNYKSTSALLHRKTPFTLSVTSLKEPWTLKVSTAGLYQGSQPFYGDLVYKNSDDSTPLVLDDNLQQIASGTSPDEKTTTDVTKNWTSDSGLLLQPTSKTTPAGKYTGTLTWELDDSEA